MPQQRLSLPAAIILATLMSCSEASMSNSQPKFILKAEKNKAFDNSALIKTLIVKKKYIAECLEHCLQDCRCHSFQICQNTKCQLCSSHKDENSSLLQDKDGCVYATYEIQQPSKTCQKLDKQCSDMNCSMKYNCCQQAGLCPENKVCKPFNSPTKPWKRFSCECRDGYYEENCGQPIRSCAGYLNVRQKSGKYKVVDSQNSPFEVYCHFGSGGAWTLVQSYNYSSVRHPHPTAPEFRTTLSENLGVNENALVWNAYRLGRSRMESIKNNSSFLQFTCNYKKHRSIDNSDYVQIYLQNITVPGEGNVFELVSDDTRSKGSRATVKNVRGKIGHCDLSRCQIQLSQYKGRSLHVHFIHNNPPPCDLKTDSQFWNYAYFGSYHHAANQNHSCIKNQNSTTQLWFGVRNP